MCERVCLCVAERVCCFLGNAPINGDSSGRWKVFVARNLLVRMKCARLLCVSRVISLIRLIARGYYLMEDMVRF